MARSAMISFIKDVESEAMLPITCDWHQQELEFTRSVSQAYLSTLEALMQSLGATTENAYEFELHSHVDHPMNVTVLRGDTLKGSIHLRQEGLRWSFDVFSIVPVGADSQPA